MLSISAYSKELEGLNQLVSRNPLFLSDKSDVQIIASRCSALYLVLNFRAEEAFQSKDPKGIASEYLEKASVYNQVREVLCKAENMSQLCINQQKDFSKSYADITVNNWKKNSDLFNGIVNNDLNVCDDNHPFFKRLARNLSKEIKK